MGRVCSLYLSHPNKLLSGRQGYPLPPHLLSGQEADSNVLLHSDPPAGMGGGGSSGGSVGETGYLPMWLCVWGEHLGMLAVSRVNHPSPHCGYTGEAPLTILVQWCMRWLHGEDQGSEGTQQVTIGTTSEGSPLQRHPSIAISGEPPRGQSNGGREREREREALAGEQAGGLLLWREAVARQGTICSVSSPPRPVTA